MKFWYPFYFVYQWLIAVPTALVLTLLTSIFTIILSPILPNHPFSYFPARWWGKLMCWVFFIRLKTNGFEHLDKKQSYVFTSNHQSMFDILVVYGWVPFIFKWIMKYELIHIPLVGQACVAAGHIFIDRSNPISAKNSLKKASEQLQHGNSVVIFPEGTRTRTGKLNKFKRGAFLLAMDLKLPIVPITLKGSFERLPMHSVLVKPGTITMTVHPPVDVTTYATDESSALLRDVQEIIRSGL